MPLRFAVRRNCRLPLLGLLVGVLVQACGSSSGDGTPTVTPSGEVDASAADATAHVDASEPPVEPSPIPACIDDSRCSPFAETRAFEPVFDTPEGVEIRGEDGVLLAFDDRNEQFVVYGATVDASNSRWNYGEWFRFDARYDRVSLGERALACQGAACELVQFRWGQSKVRRVPDELEATVVSKRCVGGRGVMCFDETDELAWRVRPEVLAAPISVFAQLGKWDFIVVDTNGSPSLIRSGVLVPFDVGTSERIVQLAAGNYWNPQEWAARTEAGTLVRGSLAGGVACNVKADGISINEVTPLAVRQGERLMIAWPNGSECYSYALPPGMVGADLSLCGVGENAFAFDAHRVFAPPASCAFD